jgi:hypothetical protein
MGGGTHDSGSSVTLVANAKENYTFMNWSENGNVVSTNPIYTFQLGRNRNIVATFEGTAPKYNVNVTINPAGAGSVTGAGSYDAGSAVTLVATANTDYTFKN